MASVRHERKHSGKKAVMHRQCQRRTQQARKRGQRVQGFVNRKS